MAAARYNAKFGTAVDPAALALTTAAGAPLDLATPVAARLRSADDVLVTPAREGGGGDGSPTALESAAASLGLSNLAQSLAGGAAGI